MITTAMNVHELGSCTSLRAAAIQLLKAFARDQKSFWSFIAAPISPLTFSFPVM